MKGGDNTTALLQIKLVTVPEVAIFNSICNSIDCKTTLRSGSYAVDAKSLMGIFSLNLSNPVTLELLTCIHIWFLNFALRNL